MVVLDGHNMLGTGPNQYLQPDYLSPLPTTLDAKKSPLALLAQTCSQIGADNPSTKSLLPSLHGTSETLKRKSSCSSDTSSKSQASDSNNQRDGSSRPKSNSASVKSGSSTSSSGGKSSPSFKPYESSSSASSKLPASHSSKNDEENPRTPKSTSTPPLAESKISRTNSPIGAGTTRASQSSVTHNKNPPSEVSPKPESTRDKKLVSEDSEKVSPGSSSKDQGASPIIRSGLEVLNGHMGSAKDLRDFHKPGLAGLAGLGYPPGFDPTHPALRPPFFSSASHHAAIAAAAAFMGYPPATGAAGSPYVGYTRVKTPSGAETIIPVCKDPYCTGCQLGMPPGLMSAAAAGPYSAGIGTAVCPAGCVQCDHQKFTIGLPFMPNPALSGIPTSTAAALASYSSSLLSQHQQAAAVAAAQQQHQQAAAAAAQRPYVCNWIVGESYCGKRFISSEELLQHLRTHTNISSSEAQASANPSSLYSNALLNSAAAAALHRTYPTPPLSPLSAARYHPYANGKPLSSFGPPHPPSMASFYQSPYPSVYGQRIGPPVHP